MVRQNLRPLLHDHTIGQGTCQFKGVFQTEIPMFVPTTIRLGYSESLFTGQQALVPIPEPDYIVAHDYSASAILIARVAGTMTKAPVP